MEYRMLCLAMSLALVSASSSAQDVYIHNGFMKAESYLGLPDARRSAYVMGLIDGFLFSPGFGASEQKVTWLHDCTVGMSEGQITAVIDQYIRANPIMWQQPVHVLANNALRAACPANTPRSSNSSKPTQRRGAA